MIVTKRALRRRTFLRGVGAAIGLPLLDAMVPAFAADAPNNQNQPLFRHIVHMDRALDL